MSKRHRRPASPRFTLSQLEDHDWGPPTYDSHLVTTIHKLRYKPIGQFTVEDLRICLGQKMSVGILLPLALDQLERDPLVSGDYYEGDLLQNVVHCEDKWPRDPQTLGRLRAVLERAVALIPNCPDLAEFLQDKLLAQCRLALERLP